MNARTSMEVTNNFTILKQDQSAKEYGKARIGRIIVQKESQIHTQLTGTRTTSYF